MIFYFGTRKSFATSRIYDFYLNCLFIWIRFFLRTWGQLLHFLEIVVGLFQMLTVSTIRFIHANNHLAVLLVHLIVVNWNRSSRRHIIVNNIRARKVHAKTLVVLPPPQWSEYLWNRLIFFCYHPTLFRSDRNNNCGPSPYNTCAPGFTRRFHRNNRNRMLATSRNIF